MIKARYIMHAVFLLAILFNLSSYLFLPDGVAIHFDRGGMPDSWMSKNSHIIFSTGLFVLLYVGFALSPNVLKGPPSRYISLPNKYYWLIDENRQEASRRMAGLMYSFGIATGLLLLASAILSAAANLSDPVKLNTGILLPIFTLYVVFTVWWVFRLFIVFRVPKE